MKSRVLAAPWWLIAVSVTNPSHSMLADGQDKTRRTRGTRFAAGAFCLFILTTPVCSGLSFSDQLGFNQLLTM